MSHSSWQWPTVITLSVIIVLGGVFLELPAVARFLSVAWFMLICPGMALVRLWRLADPLVEFVLAIALSLGLATILAMIMVYTGTWSPAWAMVVLAGVSLAGVLADVLSQIQYPRGLL